MKRYIIAAIVLMASTAWGQGDKPSLFGWHMGQMLEPNENDVLVQGLRKTIRENVAGFDSVAAVYTEKHGVCKVEGYMIVEAASGDTTGHRHKSTADKIKDRLVRKLGTDPTDKFDQNWDTLYDEPKWWLQALHRKNVHYMYFWKDIPDYGFAAVQVAGVGVVSMGIEFPNFTDCMAESEAALEAEF